MLIFNQKTIKEKINFRGIGLHSGLEVNLTLIPAPPNHGIVFKRIDIKGKKNNYIEANFSNVTNTVLCTTIQNKSKVSISTIEHLMGALYGENIDNLLIEVDAPELPILDGSAKEFVNKIKKNGFKNYDTPKKYIKVLKEFKHQAKEKFIKIEPCENDLIVDFEIIYKNFKIGNQRQKISLSKDNLSKIYNARTFCLYEDIDKVKQMGLGKGGSLENALVVKDNKILNSEGLRDANEFVMHKILDCMGDLFLSKYKIFGKVTCSQGGHKLTNEFLRRFFDKKENFSLVEFKEKELPNISSYNDSLAAIA